MKRLIEHKISAKWKVHLSFNGCLVFTLLFTEITALKQVSLVTRKPVFGVFDQVRLKPACSATETSYRLDISDLETRGIILPRQRTTKALICKLIYGINRFSHDMAQVVDQGLETRSPMAPRFWAGPLNFRKKCLYT